MYSESNFNGMSAEDKWILFISLSPRKKSTYDKYQGKSMSLSWNMLDPFELPPTYAHRKPISACHSRWVFFTNPKKKLLKLFGWFSGGALANDDVALSPSGTVFVWVHSSIF